MRDDVTLNHTPPPSNSVTASRDTEERFPTDVKRVEEEPAMNGEENSLSNPLWQATNGDSSKASRAFGLPPNAEKAGGSPDPLKTTEEKCSPKKIYTRKRSKVLSIHLTPREKEVIVTGAKKAKKTVTDFIMDSVRGAQFIVCDDLHPMLLEEKRIGNNINQIARKINSGEIQAQNFDELAKEIKLLNASLFMIVRRFYGDS